jgi:serine phosphatase RsbU (regulator of sigma subunit)
LKISSIDAQNLSANELKAAIAFKVAQKINWPNETSLTHYNLGVLTDDINIFNEFNNLLKNLKLRGKTIKVKLLTKDNEIRDIHILYADGAFSKNIKDISDRIGSAHTLLVSDGAVNEKVVMINLYSENDQLKFEINKANLINSGLIVNPSLILLGGTEIDVAKLYKDSQQSLEKEKEKVIQKEKDLDNMRLEIEKQKHEIERQKQEIVNHQQEIRQQKQEITDQSSTLTEVQKNVTSQEKLLNDKVENLKDQINKIAEQDKTIAKQKSEMMERIAKLGKLSDDINDQEVKIRNQRSVLNQRNSTIQTQKSLILLFIAILALVMILGFFIFRSYRIQKKLNNELALKSEQIRQSTLLLEQEREQTLNSIRYAQNIQDSFLPTSKEWDEVAKTFVLYRPKDIISGDFYWLCKIPNSTAFIAAVVDCTGHGVPGAFMSMIGNTLLNEIVKENEVHMPSLILELLDQKVRVSLKQDETENHDGMDICLCLIEKNDDKDSVVVFAGAQRPLYYILPGSDKIEVIKGGAKPIGGGLKLARNLKYDDHPLYLPKGTRLYLTSDGLIDQNNVNREKFGKRNLENLLIKSSGSPISEQKFIIEESLDEYQKNTVQRDDITLIGIEI